MATGREHFDSILASLADIQTLAETDPDVLEHFVTELSEIDVLVDDLADYVEERTES